MGEGEEGEMSVWWSFIKIKVSVCAINCHQLFRHLIENLENQHCNLDLQLAFTAALQKIQVVSCYLSPSHV